MSNNKTTEEIFAYPNQTIDLKVLESKGIDTIESKIYFLGIELHGGVESNQPYNECFFGELDSNDSNMGFNINKPIYFLQGGEDIDSVIARNEMTKQSTNEDSRQSTNSNAKVSNNSNMDCHSPKGLRNDKNIGTSTLQVFLHSSTLTILNYSLLDSSLHIKLECNSSESQEIQEKEKAQQESKDNDMDFIIKEVA
ncbi:hypothetical protein CQA53_10180 [Helicobacter didelphidarum]|uniref:Uncharacterized protein n=1 Tax=Helicobacter didelphidarum TaxID=2040648 RepID=A0A3D8I8I2_9HELI|nr:hypothetical protein [Helicobacter didelphidarum]RDU61418.1 hypothetical protein CQA53_10180 [Helicobacter didelphidarum]